MISNATQKEIEKYCKELGVKFKKESWNTLRTDLHKALEKKAVDYPTYLSPYYLRYGNEIAQVLTNPSYSHSDKIRVLYDLGVIEVKELSKITGRHYSFVHGVVKKYKEKGNASSKIRS